MALQFVCTCAAIISLSVSPFRSPLDSYRNTSSSPISCLSILLITGHALLCYPIFFSRTLLIFLLCVECLPFFVSLFSFNWFNSSANFAVVLLNSYLVDCFCDLTIFTNWSSAYFVFIYSAVLFNFALCVTSICNRPFLLFLVYI